MQEGARRLDADTILVEFGQLMEAVSTLPVATPSGLSRGAVEAVVFKRVRGEELSNLAEYYARVVGELGLSRAIVVTTAAPIDQKFRHVRVEEASADLYMTVSLEPPVCLDSKVHPPMALGTINIVAAVHLPLSYNALVDLLKTLVEAKALASSDSLLRCRTRSPGTVSDSVTVLRPLNADERIAFAGMSTQVGNAIARAVYDQIVREALSRSASELLKDLVGVDVESVLRLFSEVYSKYPVQGLSTPEAVAQASRALKRALKDPNVWSLIIAARELDLHGLAGSIPEVTREEFASDSKRIVADEIIGMSLATYLAGTNGLFTMYWVERLKEGGVVKYEGQGVFSDDVVSALLAYAIVDVVSRASSEE